MMDKILASVLASESTFPLWSSYGLWYPKMSKDKEARLVMNMVLCRDLLYDSLRCIRGEGSLPYSGTLTTRYSQFKLLTSANKNTSCFLYLYILNETRYLYL